ncbi:MAG: hypothetical protein ACFE95_23015, partial [Candidatus Hodarchaeota archaeon]
VVEKAKASESDFIAISTYSGIALTYVKSLFLEMSKYDLKIPILIGGKLTQIPDYNTSSSKPIDVTDQLSSLGAIVCHSIEDVIENLLKTAQEKYH